LNINDLNEIVSKIPLNNYDESTKIPKGPKFLTCQKYEGSMYDEEWIRRQ